MQENSHRIDSVKQYVYSQIILQVVHQVRLVQVLLDDVPSIKRLRAILNNLLTVSGEVNSLSLRKCIRLHNVSLL